MEMQNVSQIVISLSRQNVWNWTSMQEESKRKTLKNVKVYVPSEILKIQDWKRDEKGRANS